MDLERLKSWVQEATSELEPNRERAQVWRDNYDGKQWTAAQEAILRKNKQPVITSNRIQPKIDAMLGIENRGRSDPQALPRNPNDDEAADIATKALRFVEETQKVDWRITGAFENMLIEGIGALEITHKMAPDGTLDVAVGPVRFEDLLTDPHSREKDYSDARMAGILKWMAEDDARQFMAPFFQGSEEDLLVFTDTKDAVNAGSTFEDRPNGGMTWFDRNKRRVRVCQMYYREGGEWRLAIFTGRGMVYDEVSPYQDEYGKPHCPIVMMSAYVDRENNRYGLVKGMISIQQEINVRRSKALHFINSRQFILHRGVADADEVRRELSRPDGIVEINAEIMLEGIKPFELIQTADMAQGNLAMLQEAKGEIDMLGPNASLIGQGGATSGRQEQIQQQAGLASISPVYDALDDFKERIYRAIWGGIKQFWIGPKWIRITEDENAPQFVGINQPTIGPDGVPVMMNPIGQIDVDIIIDSAPEYATLRAEQFDKLADMAGRGVPIPPKLIIEASDLRDKRKLLEALEPPPEAQQAMQQAEQQAMAMAQAKEQADIEATRQKAYRDNAAGQKDLASIGEIQAKGQSAMIEASAKTVIAQSAGL